MSTDKTRSVAILAAHGFEQAELDTPRTSLRRAGVKVHIIAPEGDEIVGRRGESWGSPVPVTRALPEAEPYHYDAVVLPGGEVNLALLRANDDALAFVQAMQAHGKPIAAIGYAPLLLARAGLVAGRRLTSLGKIQHHLRDAGAEWSDEPVICDSKLITARHAQDLPQFCDTLIGKLMAGVRVNRAA